MSTFNIFNNKPINNYSNIFTNAGLVSRPFTKNISSGQNNIKDIGSKVIDNNTADPAYSTGIFSHNNQNPIHYYTNSLAGVSKKLSGNISKNNSSKIIRSTLLSTAIRQNKYNFITNNYEEYYIKNSFYILPADNLNGITYKVGNSTVSNRSSNQNSLTVSYCWCENSIAKESYDNFNNTNNLLDYSASLCLPYKDHISELDVPNRSMWRYISTSPTTGYQPIYNPFNPDGLGEEGTTQQKTEWLNVPEPGNIKIYMYYTQCITNVFLPGFGWHRSMGAGGHRCDNAEYNVYIKVSDKWFFCGEVNFNNLEPSDTQNTFIQNKTPFDVMQFISINIDNTYFEALLKGVNDCETGDRPIIDSKLRLVAKNGTAHAVPLTIHIVLGGKYCTWHYSKGYSPTCPDVNNPFPEDTTDGDNEIVNPATYIPDTFSDDISDVNTLKLLPYSLCDQELLFSEVPPSLPNMLVTDFTNSSIAGEIGLSITDNPSGDIHISNQNCSPILNNELQKIFKLQLENFPEILEKSDLAEFIADIFSSSYNIPITEINGIGIGEWEIFDLDEKFEYVDAQNYNLQILISTNNSNILQWFIILAGQNFVNGTQTVISLSSTDSNVGGWAANLINSNSGQFDATISCVSPN